MWRSTIRRRLPGAIMLALSLVLALPLAAFIPTGARALATAQETLTAPFANGPNGATTTNTYSGSVSINVSGSGQAAATAFSDAFYVFTDNSGNPITPEHHFDFGLCINSQTVDNYLATTPPYSSSHTYQFMIPIGSSAQQITFGVCDTFTVDNSGSFTITVQVVSERVLGAAQAVDQALPRFKETMLNLHECLSGRTPIGSTVNCSVIITALNTTTMGKIAFCLVAGAISPPAGVLCLAKVAVGVVVKEGLILLAGRIANDPPRSDFDQIVELEPIPPFEPFDKSSFAEADAEYTTLLAEQNALLEAILITFERLQGAIGANSEQFVLLQSEELVNFLDQLAETQGKLKKAIERVSDTFESFLRGDVKRKLMQLAAQGFSAEERQLLQDAGLSPEDIQILEQFLLSLPPNANFNKLVQQGLKQWKLFVADIQSTVKDIVEIFEDLVLEDDDD